MEPLTEAEKALLRRALAVYRQELWRESDKDEYRRAHNLTSKLMPRPQPKADPHAM